MQPVLIMFITTILLITSFSTAVTTQPQDSSNQYIRIPRAGIKDAESPCDTTGEVKELFELQKDR